MKQYQAEQLRSGLLRVVLVKAAAGLLRVLRNRSATFIRAIIATLTNLAQKASAQVLALPVNEFAFLLKIHPRILQSPVKSLLSLGMATRQKTRPRIRQSPAKSPQSRAAVVVVAATTIRLLLLQRMCRLLRTISLRKTRQRTLSRAVAMSLVLLLACALRVPGLVKSME
ncbi:hypothetical protein CK623_00155 [Vandammella animalimorsus]|uniref:Uncharacterized protein n=1 Tax=Vandammella animalimorsus TaxID=2029117 RepID=A0A2A2AUJ9_9BURK|nr:hypothetical protein CK623_00155 [Vandammella animalimorsus]